MQKLIINPDFKQLIPSLTADEYNQLEQNIIDEGCREPLITWNDTIIDGHNRYEICTKHDIPFKVVKKDFKDDTDAKIWIIKNQFGRRNLQKIDRILLVSELEPLLQEKAKQNEINMGIVGARITNEKLHSNKVDERGLTNWSNPVPIFSDENKSDSSDYGENEDLNQLNADNQVIETSDNFTPVNTRKELAKMADISEGTLSRVKKIEKTKPEMIDKIRTGEITINKAFNEIKKEERIKDVEKQKKDIEEGNIVLPEGVFEIVVVDPPWPYGTEYDPDGRRAANPYPEMSLEEIKSINLPTAENCVLFLWTTHKFMRYSFNILDSWGFRDVAIITWVKDRMGLGTWLRSQSEFCIMAVKGKPQILLTNQTTIIQGAMREHSRKPEEFYQMVDELCVGRKLDYFSREKKVGWETFGNDSEKFTLPL